MRKSCFRSVNQGWLLASPDLSGRMPDLRRVIKKGSAFELRIILSSKSISEQELRFVIPSEAKDLDCGSIT
jgi:hypothetical protein